ncbi:MAG: pyridoxine 5'-phosphate synthase [Ignavibacteriales bacterium]|nr:pyridoxine 5'-phosphate synthase [Ignavibacteriales bacterium]
MRLCINIDHVATLRNAREEREPDPVAFALRAEHAGVDGIVVHLREDRRHIKDRDVRLLRETIKTKLDLEMSLNEEIVEIAREVRPELATIVPERRQELTTEGGLDVAGQGDVVARATERLHEKGVAVSLFVEPDERQIDASKACGADFVEIHTGAFANAPTDKARREEFDRAQRAVRRARELGLGVNAGHGLDYVNMKLFREIEGVEEVSLGHAMIARAVVVGVENAVREMFAVMRGER